MHNLANTGVVWNLATNSHYLLVPNHFYNTGSGFNLLDQANLPDSFNGNPPLFNQAPPPSNLNVFNTIWQMLGNSSTVAENVDNPPMVDVVGIIGVGECQNVGNPLIPSMIEIVENVEIEEAENVGKPLNSPMVEVVGNVGIGDVENVGNTLGSLLLDNPPMVEAENVEKPPEFNPQDLQLIIHFLTRRLRNESLEENTIHEINFYDYLLQYLTDNYTHGVPGILFFFTPVQRLYQQKAVQKVNGEGGGSWCRVSGHVKWIKDNGNRVVGSVKTFKFAPKNPNPNDVTWLMKEYNLPNEA